MEYLTISELANLIGMLQLQLLDAKGKIAELEGRLEKVEEPVNTGNSES